MDLTETITPRSDQLNSDDLLASARTVTITDVRSGSAEQPVEIHTAEFPGRPFKPSKTVRRILVSAWGSDGDAYVGRRLTLYRDPDVKFGGQDVGGIRVSHMSHIAKPMKLALTVSKGKKGNYVVQPLVDAVAAPAPDRATGAQLAAIVAAFEVADITEPAARLAYASQVVGRELGSAKELTGAEASAVIQALQGADQ